MNQAQSVLENPVLTKIMFEEFMNNVLNPREKAKHRKVCSVKNLH